MSYYQHVHRYKICEGDFASVAPSALPGRIYIYIDVVLPARTQVQNRRRGFSLSCPQRFNRANYVQYVQYIQYVRCSRDVIARKTFHQACYNYKESVHNNNHQILHLEVELFNKVCGDHCDNL